METGPSPFINDKPTIMGYVSEAGPAPALLSTCIFLACDVVGYKQICVQTWNRCIYILVQVILI